MVSSAHLAASYLKQLLHIHVRVALNLRVKLLLRVKPMAHGVHHNLNVSESVSILIQHYTGCHSEIILLFQWLKPLICVECFVE